jgi:hypothetical protein
LASLFPSFLLLWFPVRTALLWPLDQEKEVCREAGFFLSIGYPLSPRDPQMVVDFITRSFLAAGSGSIKTY